MTRSPSLIAVALLSWLVCFAVLAQLGTWTPFAFVGVLLVVLALRSSALPVRQFRPSRHSLLIGVGAGVLMVILTHLSYGWLCAIFPGVRAGTSELLSLLNVVGFSPPARAALIVVIASCEEVLFRGLLPGSARGSPRPIQAPQAREFGAIAAWSAIYALTTIPLRSALLVLCAFVCGTLWGTLRVATRSVLVPILAHVLWDLGVLLVWPLPS
ncbi:MAG TPA: CPBP family intramembrane glutamic endopeptidase [Polyangiaceae bacterium]|nr:CPBP family intramembrane glutamic endopeptidase [Polyangiaceae bacterium]